MIAVRGARASDARSSVPPRAGRSLLTALAMLVVLGGCTVSQTRLEVALRERDSRRPIADARVVVQSMHLMLLDGSKLNPLEGSSEAATTDAFGIAVIEAPVSHPFQLSVFRPFEPTLRATFDAADHPGETRAATAWIELLDAAPDDQEPVIEVQLRPTPG